MATVNKDFKIKNGLVVEGTTGTINNHTILTETDGDAYILSLVGGSGTPDNTPNTIVQRDENGDFAAGTITADDLSLDANGRLNVGSVGYIEAQDNDDFYITAQNGYDIRIEASDDLRMYANAGDVVVTGNQNGHIRFVDAPVHIGFPVTTDNQVATQGYVDQAETDAVSSANSYTDTELEDYTPTSSLDATVGGYGYLKNADLPAGYSDADVDAHLSGGNGINYSLGEISAHLGSGLEFSVNGEIQIDENVVATQTDLSDAITAHNNLSDVHGVTGEVLGTTDTQTISNKTLGSDLAAGGFQITNLGAPQNSTDAATKAYVDAVSEGLHVHAAARLATEENVSIANALEAGDFLGDAELQAGDRILVRAQDNLAENGIYVVQASGQALRATDFDTATEVDSGDFIFVSEGIYGGTGWVQVFRPATIGTDEIFFTQFSGAGAFQAGNGLSLDGTEFRIDTSITATRTYVGTEIGDHASDTATHGVTEIVGASENQTLTNKTLGSSTVLGANLDAANTYTVANLQEPVSNQDAATKYYVDTELSTGLNTKADAENPTITGSVTLSGSGDFTITSDSNIVLDANTTAYLESATAGNEIATQGYVDNAISNIDLVFNTDEVSEGVNNLYFTNERAKTSAAEALTNAQLTNITITGDGSLINPLVITAENGVADSTTADLAEDPTADGTTGTWYFTNQRAVDALQAVVPNFTAVELDSIAKQIAATVSAPTAASQITAYSFAKADYRSAKFLIKAAYGSHTELTEVLLTLDSSDNIAITEYATIGTNGSSMAVTADISGSDVRLRVTPVNNDSTITVVGTLLA